jgi:hypothetical protein
MGYPPRGRLGHPPRSLRWWERIREKTEDVRFMPYSACRGIPQRAFSPFES